MEATIKLLKEMGLDAASIERCLAGATNVSVNVFEGNDNIVVIGGNYFESGSKGSPSQKSKRARLETEFEDEDEDMGEVEDSPEPRSRRDRECPSSEEEESLVDKVQAHFIRNNIDIDGIDLKVYERDTLDQLLLLTNDEEVYALLLPEDDEDSRPF